MQHSQETKQKTTHDEKRNVKNRIFHTVIEKHWAHRMCATVFLKLPKMTKYGELIQVKHIRRKCLCL